MNDLKIDFAPQDIVDAYDQEMEEIEATLDSVLNIRGAWISDESRMMDFYSYDPEKYMDDHRAFCKEIGLEFDPTALVIDVAKMLHERNNPPTIH